MKLILTYILETINSLFQVYSCSCTLKNHTSTALPENRHDLRKLEKLTWTTLSAKSITIFGKSSAMSAERRLQRYYKP